MPHKLPLQIKTYRCKMHTIIETFMLFKFSVTQNKSETLRGTEMKLNTS